MAKPKSGEMRGRWVVLMVALGILLPTSAWAEEAKREATHAEGKKIQVKGENKANRLQTLCMAPSGEVLALLGLPRYGTTERDIPSEVQVFSPTGEKLRTYKVGFAGQAINASSDGHIFVAGSGKIAELASTGSLLSEMELPHLAELVKDKAALRKKAEEQLKSEREMYQQMVDQFKKQKEELEKKDKDQLTANEKAQLRSIEATLKAYAPMLKEQNQRTVESAMADLTARLRQVNAVAVTDKEIFVATGESKGYGFAVWRMTREFKEPKQIISGLGGCCGQMDIQATADSVFVCENTKHKVFQFDREGKRLAGFGKKGRDGDPECFGSCCNPMNCCIAKDGSVYTAESEGYVKHFAADGKFLGPIGSVKITGGCKNVGLGVSPDGDTLYFCDQPGSNIIILAKKTDTAAKP